MKHHFERILIFFFVLSFSTMNGQNSPLEKKATCSVYFASGSAELDAAALEALTTFITNSNLETSAIEMRLQAFTDDVGSPKHNEALARKRALAVQLELVEQGVDIGMIKTQKSQQLHLNPDQNAAEQRKKNRRVDVEWWGRSHEMTVDAGPSEEEVNAVALAQFFEKNKQKAQQQFNFLATKGSIIEGAKGTILQVPPNCFVDQNGKEVKGTVSFTLQEAYSYGDMLLQDLSTVSDGKLLETGGMLFIEAKDSLGNQLVIGEGKEITAAMASEEAELPDMQTFSGVVDTNTNRIDWVARNQPVLVGGNGVNLWTDGEYKGQPSVYKPCMIGENIKQVDKTPEWNQKMPKELDRPRFRMRCPKYPRLIITKKPSKGALREHYVKQKSEAKIKYNKRIRKKYVALQASYLKKKQKNNKRLNQYKRDSIQYERSLAKHEQKVIDYKEYNDQMRLVLEEMYTNMTDFKISTYAETYEALGEFVETVSYNNASMLSVKQGIQYRIENASSMEEARRALLEKMNNIELRLLTKEEHSLLKKNWSKKKIDRIIPRFYRINYQGYNIRQLNSRFRMNRLRVANLNNRISSEGNLNPYKLRQIRIYRKRVKEQYNYKLLSKVNTNVQESIKKMRPVLDCYVKMEEALEVIQKDYASIKNELDLLSPEEVAATYRNALTIRRVGWINCDRFLRNINRTDIEIVTGTTLGTRVFALFDGSRSMMRAESNGRNFVLAGVPKDRTIKLIGIRFLGQKMEVFIEEGRIGNLNGVVPHFKQKTPEELEQMMTAI